MQVILQIRRDDAGIVGRKTRVLRDTFVEVNETLDDELFLFAAIRALIRVAVHECAMCADERGTGSPVLLVAWDIA